MRATIDQTDTQRVTALLEQRILERAEVWLPTLRGTPTVRLHQLADRPRSALYLADLSTVHDRATVLAKVRKDAPLVSRDGARPRFAADPLPADKLTRLELAGLRAIHEGMGGDASRFGTVRPLDHVTSPSVIFMEWVSAVPLRGLLTGRSRLVPAVMVERRGAAGAWNAWSDVGAWLRAFQAAVPVAGMPPRTSTAREVVELFEAFGEFLSRRLGDSGPSTLADSGARLAAGVLPECLEVTVGHGDYAPRNVLVDARGRLTVVDPLPRWAVSRYEDLCRFLVGVRFVGLQVHTHGLAYRDEWIARIEREAIGGYFQDEDVPMAQLRCFQLLIMLDKWCALVDGGGAGWRGRLGTVSAARASRYFAREGEALLELALAGRG